MNKEFIENLIKLLESKKLKNIEAFDLSDKSELIKSIVLATAQNEKMNKQIANEIKQHFFEQGVEVLIDGEFPGDWIILDMGEILVELFTEDMRNHYSLEKLWGSQKNSLIGTKQKYNYNTHNKHFYIHIFV